MRLLLSIFNFQLEKAVNKRNALVFLFIAVILQVFLQVGKENHSDILESNETFLRLLRGDDCLPTGPGFLIFRRCFFF